MLRLPEQDPRWARPIVARLRALCLSLPDTTETLSWGHPNFKAGGKTFCAFEVIKGRPSIAFRLEPGDIAVVRQRKDAFETPYGRGQWISLWVDGRVNAAVIARLVRLGHRTVTAPRRHSSAGVSRRRAPRPRPASSGRR